jgi:hypothetical protein
VAERRCSALGQRIGAQSADGAIATARRTSIYREFCVVRFGLRTFELGRARAS